VLHSNCCAQLRSDQHQRRLHTSSRTAFHLPRWKGLLFRWGNLSFNVVDLTDIFSFCDLGSHWPSANLLTRTDLLWALHFLRRGRSGPNHILLRRPKISKISNQVPHGTLAFRRSCLNPPSDTSQLPFLGCRWLHIPEGHPTEVLRLVVKTELPH